MANRFKKPFDFIHNLLPFRVAEIIQPDDRDCERNDKHRVKRRGRGSLLVEVVEVFGLQQTKFLVQVQFKPMVEHPLEVKTLVLLKPGYIMQVVLVEAVVLLFIA